ncbi:hypothetical protein BDZ89DRAFT_1083562, partial [Hymenopellis radicata]
MEGQFTVDLSQPTAGSSVASWQTYSFPLNSANQAPLPPSYPSSQSSVFSVDSLPGSRNRRSSAPGRYSQPLSIPTIPTIPERREDEDQYSLPLHQRRESAPATSLRDVINPSVPFSHSQPRLHAPRQPKRDPYADMDALLPIIKSQFKNLGFFLRVLFADFRRRKGPDKRTLQHRSLVAGFLRGKCSVKAAEIVDLIYRHRSSRPSYRSKNRTELDSMFSGSTNPSSLQYAHPAISCWAIQIVGDTVHKLVGDLTRDEAVADADDNWEDVDASASDTEIPRTRQPLHARLAASKKPNARKKDDRAIVTWDIVESFRVKEVAAMMIRRAGLVWYLTERMAAMEKKGQVVVRKQRPHSTIQVSAISSFVLSRNRYTNGYLALPLGIWLWACRAHVDIKRILCRMGLGVSDKTVRKALMSMADLGQKQLQDVVKEFAERGELACRVIMDNQQAYALVREQGHGKESVLLCGTGATAVHLIGCPPGAFLLQPYLENLIKNKHERTSLTVDKLVDDMDLPHMDYVLSLHWVRSLIDFIPLLHHLKAELSAIFRSEPVAVNRLPVDHATKIQPLRSNAEREIELDGSKNCIIDFDTQMGWKEEWSSKLMTWYGGDGGTYNTIKRLKKHVLATAPGKYMSFSHVLNTPEIWHVGSTMVGTVATNHYGPASSPDPSSLSRLSTAASQKRPSDLSKPDYYSTTRAMKLMWNAQVLDCWRTYSIHLCPDSSLESYFENLETLPSLDELVCGAKILQKRYGSLNAHEHVLSKSDWENADPILRPPEGPAWSSTRRSHVPRSGPTLEEGDASDADDSSSANDHRPATASDGAHVEKPGFDGDRPAANAALFKYEFGLWIEFAYAIPEGDIGRTWNIIKIWILIFGGSTNTNYMVYLLDMYCLLTYDAPEKLRIAEHHNHVVEELVERTGKPFDDPAWRNVASPNVHHVTRLKDEMETGFDLKNRGNSHTMDDTRNELVSAMTVVEEEYLHTFRTTRSQGHKATGLLNNGYERLDSGRLGQYNSDSLEDIEFLEMVLKTLESTPAGSPPPSFQSPEAPPRTPSP